MEIRLDRKSAIVTGGSQGLGLATALRLAEAGADVAILALGDNMAEAERLLKASTTGRTAAIVCDLTDEDDVRSGYEKAMGALGKVDILINNAGTHTTASCENISDDLWQADLDLKFFAAVRLVRLLWPQMKERRWGRIINVLSVAAKAPRPGSAPSAVSRAAGMSLTKVLAGEGAPHNILVNALLPGLFDTPSTAGYPVPTDVPLGRMGRPEELANIACFLASDLASYITGAAINVDGGRSPVV